MTVRRKRPRPMRKIPAVIRHADHEAITLLAERNDRSVGEEYRAAVGAWLARHEVAQPTAAAA